jgi:hypothetical protein
VVYHLCFEHRHLSAFYTQLFEKISMSSFWHFNNSPRTKRRPPLGLGKRQSGFFGRWLRRQRPFPVAARDDVSLATSEPAAVY